ncbi:ABC transporter ATP-binding protein [Thiomicrorhabdus hydrogeniphila]
MSDFIQLEKVSLSYNGSEKLEDMAIHEVNLTIKKGSFTAVVGPSGCGKSTMMKLLSGLQAPTLGYVFMNNREVNGPVSGVGMAFQKSTLLPWRNIIDNVLLPFEVSPDYERQYRKNKQKYIDKATELLEQVGLKGYEDSFPWELSGGMQQRASICRALVHEPSLLILDEPFGALDSFTREELWVMLSELQEAKKFTVLLVTHDLEEASYLADDIYVMSTRPGQIVHEEKVDFTRPRSIDIRYDTEFTHLVQKLRGFIKAAKEAA